MGSCEKFRSISYEKGTVKDQVLFEHYAFFPCRRMIIKIPTCDSRHLRKIRWILRRIRRRISQCVPYSVAEYVFSFFTIQPGAAESSDFAMMDHISTANQFSLEEVKQIPRGRRRFFA